PTYREERRVLQMTVLSAALARYGRRNIVVLVDDPPESASRPRTLQAVADVREWLEVPMSVLRAEANAAAVRLQAGMTDAHAEAQQLAALYEYAADWLGELSLELRAEASDEFAHVDGFFVDDVMLGLASTYRQRAAAIAVARPMAGQVADEYER